MTHSFWKSKWFAFGIALIPFAAGSLMTAAGVGCIDAMQADGSSGF